MNEKKAMRWIFFSVCRQFRSFWTTS